MLDASQRREWGGGQAIKENGVEGRGYEAENPFDPSLTESKGSQHMLDVAPTKLVEGL